MAEGDIGAVIDSLEFDTVYCYMPDMIHVSGDVCAIAYKETGGHGCLKTVTIESDGQIGAAAIDSIVFSDVSGDDPNIIHISDDVYAVAYTGNVGVGFLKTVTIESDGQIGAAEIDSFSMAGDYCVHPDMIHVSGDVYALFYRGTGSDGFIKTIEIASNGQIGAAAIDSLEFDTNVCANPKGVHVSGDVFAVAYDGTDNDGFIKTIEITSSGQIGAAEIDSLEFDTGSAQFPSLIHVSGDVFAVAYATSLVNCRVATMTIESDGQIGAAVVDTFNFAAAGGVQPNMIHVSGDVYAIACQGEGSDGWLRTITIESDGQIGAAEIDSLEFDTDTCLYPNMIHVSGDVCAIAYVGTGDDGFLKTVTIETIPEGGPKHLMIMGVG